MSFALLLSFSSIAQPYLPIFLQGTWKVENKNVYEHWDMLNEKSLKGFSYSIQNEQLVISEYLEIIKNEHDIIYTATVLNQNQGKGIHFTLSKNGNTFTFENPEHDFPKKIVYQMITENEVLVQVSDGKQKGFAYRMHKQSERTIASDSTILNPNYNPELAVKLGADDYGMKRYILVILKTGSNQTTDKDFINKCFRGHMDNINRLVEDGKLVVAGPLGSNDKTYRGIFILNAATPEEADLLLQTDPAIKERLLDAELYPWYGSAALPEYLPASNQIWKLNP
jgi:uncharacterized protein YciI